MLENLFENQLLLGASQAAAAFLLAVIVMLLARWQAIHIERETLTSLVRGLLQIVLVGSVLVFILDGPGVVGVIVLGGMMVAAAAIAARRAKGIPGAFQVTLAGIVVGAGSVIAVGALLGVIGMDLASLIPVGSMLIANSMNSSAQALERFKAEVQAHQGLVEAGLALGAAPQKIVLPYARAAIHASLIPRIDTLRSLGIVWIPGIMAGMILAGEDPVYASIYQFVIIAIIFAAAGLSSLVSTLMIRSRAFTEAEQLILRRSVPSS